MTSTEARAPRVSIEECADATFKPWDKSDQPDFTKQRFDNCAIFSKAAYVIMTKTKDDLVSSFDKASEETAMQLVEGLNDTAVALEGLAKMVRAAEIRYLCAGVAWELKNSTDLPPGQT